MSDGRSGPERRRHPRIQLQHKVLIEVGDQASLAELYTRDMSQGGIFVVTELALPLGAEVQVEVHVPVLPEPLVLSARVARQQPASQGAPAGLGLELRDVPPGVLERFNALLREAVALSDARAPLAASARAPAAAGAGRAPVEGDRAPGRRALVIEDEPAVAGLLAAALAERGLGAQIVANGAQGLMLATAGSFDLAVVDALLPDMDGLEVVRRLRAQCPQLPIIALAASFRGLEQRALYGRAGATSFLIKPLSALDVGVVLDGVLVQSGPAVDRLDQYLRIRARTQPAKR